MKPAILCQHLSFTIIALLMCVLMIESRGLSSRSSRRHDVYKPISQAFLQLPEPSSLSPLLLPALPPLQSTSSSPSSSSAAIACDFDSFEKGCEDEQGSFCETTSQRCLCQEGFPIRLLAYCLSSKEIGQDCYTSSQCKNIEHAACFIFGKEYDNERISGGHNVGRQVSNWPTGTCRCHIGYQWDNSSMSCVKKTIGSWCNDDWDCIKDKFNTQCSRPQNLCECAWGFYYDPKTDSCQVPKLYGLKCTSNEDCSDEKFVCSETTFRCSCPTGTHWDPIHPGCKPNNDSSCDKGYKWDSEWDRCIPVRAPGSAFPFNQINSNINRNSATNKDNRQRESIDSKATVNSTDNSTADESSPLQTVLILVLPIVATLFLIIHCCYHRKQEEDALERDLERRAGGGPGLTHLRLSHNFPKFCSYPPYGRPTLINSFPGPCCVGPTGKLHTAKLAVLEAVVEEEKQESISLSETEAGGEKTTENTTETTVPTTREEVPEESSKEVSSASASDPTASDSKTDDPEALVTESNSVSTPMPETKEEKETEEDEKKEKKEEKEQEKTQNEE